MVKHFSVKYSAWDMVYNREKSRIHLSRHKLKACINVKALFYIYSENNFKIALRKNSDLITQRAIPKTGCIRQYFKQRKTTHRWSLECSLILKAKAFRNMFIFRLWFFCHFYFAFQQERWSDIVWNLTYLKVTNSMICIEFIWGTIPPQISLWA